ncbi:ABC transporter substrate-binding protein [Rhodococcus sp. NPDC003348]
MAALAAVLAATTIAACGNSGSSDTAGGAAAKPETAGVDMSGVTLNVGEIGGFTRQYFEASGALDGIPYTVEWKKIGGGAPMFQALGSDAVNVSVQGVDPALFSAAAGAVPFKIVGIAGKNPTDHPENHGTFWLATRPGLDITSPADLVGKRIAVSPAKASSPHYFLAKTLKDSGIGIDEVDPVFLDSAAGLGALLSGQVDAWAGGGASFTRVQEAGGKVIAWSSEHTDNFLVTTANNKSLGDPKLNAAIADFQSRLIRNQVWTNTDKDAYAKVQAEVTKLPAATALAAVQAELPLEYFPLTADVVQRLQAEADLTREFGLTDAQVTISDIVDDRYDDVVEAARQ